MAIIKQDYGLLSGGGTLDYDGYEAYMLAKENIFDAIILDLMLPEMSRI